MFDQLVGGGVLSEAEFWKARSDQVAARARRGAPTASPTARPPGQRPGLASALLKDAPDGRATFRLTPELVHQIFAERPYVRAAYASAVPRTLTEADFWKRYLKFEGVRKARRRLRAAGRNPDDAGLEDELFRQFRAADRAAASGGGAGASSSTAPPRPSHAVDPGVDLAADADDVAPSTYGIAHSAARDAPRSARDRDALAHELNRHARVVLAGVPTGLPSDAADAARALRGGVAEPDTSYGGGGDVALWRARAGAGLDDLRSAPVPEFVALAVADSRSLGKAAAAARAAAAAASAPADTTPAAVAAALRAPLPPLPPAPAVAAALRELASDCAPEPGTEAPGSLADPTASLAPALAALVRGTVLTVNELLRHYWASVPARTPARAARATRLAAALSSQYDRVQAMVDAAVGTERGHVLRLLKPIMAALDAALARQEEEVAAAAAGAGPAPMEVGP